MRLVRPEALLLLLLAIPVVLAWLRRPPLPTRRVSSLLLLRALPGVARQRRRLRDALGLALLLGALFAGALGLALETGPAPRPWIAVLDNGTGMDRTTNAGPTRWDLAKAALGAELSARPGAPVTVLTTSPAGVLVAGDPDERRVLTAVASLSPGGDGADPTPLLAALCAPAIDLVWLSDDTPPDTACTTLQPSLGEGDNRGLTALVARATDGMGLVEVEARVSGDGSTSAKLWLDGVEVGRTQSGRATLVATRGGTLEARLEGEDHRPQDDHLSLTLPTAQPIWVGLVTDTPLGFTAAALRAHPRVRLRIAGPSADGLPSDLDLLVLEAAPTGPLPTTQRTALLGVYPDGFGVTPTGATARPAVVSLEPDHALLRFVDPTGLHVPRAMTLAPPAGGQALLGATAGPVLVEGPIAGGPVEDRRVVALGFHPASSDLPLRVDYVHWIANLVDWADPSPPMVARAPTRAVAEVTGAAPGAAAAPTAAGVRLDWWLGALLGLVLLLAESARTLARRRR